MANIRTPIPRRAALPVQPGKMRMTITRKTDGICHTALPTMNLRYERHHQLTDIAAHNDEDAAEIARHSLFIEEGASENSSKSFHNRKPQTKAKSTIIL